MNTVIHRSKSLILLAVVLWLTAHAFGDPSSEPPAYIKGRIYTSDQTSGQFFQGGNEAAFETYGQPDEHVPTIMIDPDKTFQTIDGFGGAFTDAAAEVYGQLSEEQQAAFMKANFDPVDGNGYTLCRTSIHSCDYASAPYSYAEVPDDVKLDHFSIEHDFQYRIPMIRDAQKIVGEDLKIFASPWSPPAWMKTNQSMLYGGKLRPEYRQTWADYFVRFVKAYEKAGIPMWGLTVQNEAMATQVWESCVFTAEEERDFVRDYLGPTLWKNDMQDIKLSIWDHNRGIMYQRAEVMYEDPEAAKYVWGTAFHWYVGDHYDNVRMVHDSWPEKKLLYSEAGQRGTWEAAERLAKNMIMDLNNWTNAWVYWNLLLDQNNGPRHAGGNLGSNIVTADLETGAITYNPPFHYFGHFSKFIRPGAKRIACTSNDDDLVATACVNEDESIAVVVLNEQDYPKKMFLYLNGKVMRAGMPAHSVVTFHLPK